jgi:hypothetical protein
METAVQLDTEMDPGLAWVRAKAAFESAGDHDQGAFERLLGRYIRDGHYVWSSPEAFILGAVCRWTADGELEADPSGDVWFVHLAATGMCSERRRVDRLPPGHLLRWFLKLAPFPRPWVAWQRFNRRIRIYEWNTLVAVARRHTPERKVHHGQHH